MSRRRYDETASERVGRVIAREISKTLGGGFAFMLGVPLLHKTLGAPYHHPGYWISVATMLTIQTVVGACHEDDDTR